MSNRWRAGVCVVALALCVAPAQAQQRRGGFGLHSLVANKSVQEELKLDDEQKTKVEELNKTTRATLEEKTKDLQGDDRREKLPGIMRELNAATEKTLTSTLKPGQLKRLKQIQLQVQGVRAFGNEDTQKALKLTEEQAKEVKAVLEEARKQIQEETKDIPREDRQKRREVTQKINKETMGKITDKLTAEQKKAWKEMTGKPFEIRVEQQ
jgi:hypothetical protein